MTTERILAICRSNWEYRGVDDEAVRDMLAELSAHLEDAAAAGRVPQDVVGDDVKAFAAAWARARMPLRLRLLRMAVLVPSAMGGLLLVAHLIRWEEAIPVTPGRLAFWLTISSVTVAVEIRRGTLGLGKGWLVAVGAGLPVLILTEWLAGDEPLFHVALWASVLLTLPGAAYAIARRTRIQMDKPRAK
ncbi:hypothetical protein [Streptomyces sp. NBC_01481]|uniref:hypothetical protein n=1 Tax=Streptomyces sp. NBC_01481 TaxID=2975869 RepID=UPI00224CD263|nr:hypothetical protein [Streptomyces sp. NBC_01481]MCX4585174.1 hypothetical protein [Streptomyces sp. NBC_01481]